MKNLLATLVTLFSLCATFSQVSPAEKAALLAFYNATNGPTWDSETDADPTNDWDFSGPVTNNWYGLNIAAGHVTTLDMNPIDHATASNIQSGTIPDELADLRWLIILDISASGLTGNFPVSLTTLPDLRILNLWYNDLTGTVPIEVTDMLTLTELRLSGNEFTGFIYPEYGDLINLQLLTLNENDLTGTIPASLGNLTSLHTLRLGNQPLTGTLPVSLRNLTNLVELSIGRTRITGNLPPEYSDMASLKFLFLSSGTNVPGSGLTGSIPDSYGNLRNLRTFDLLGQSLSGSLPPSLSNWVDMEYFNISHNSITGILPAAYSSWVKMERFLARNNLLTGPIPDNYRTMTELRLFDVSTNQLSGTFSVNFAQWIKLTSFDVSHNQMNGPIPEEFDRWTELEHFQINGNMFVGMVPDTYKQWSKLRTLYLGENNFEGPLPDFSGITGLHSFTIDTNSFQFGDFENEFDDYKNNISFFRDNPQAEVDLAENLEGCSGSAITLTTTVSGSANRYQWLKAGVPILGANAADLILDPLDVSDSETYTCEITSTIVTDLTLMRRPITLTVTQNNLVANDVADISACDDDTDGFADFTIDLAAIEAQVIGGQTGLTVSYFDNAGDPLALTGTFTNTDVNRQSITIRVTDAQGCFQETGFDLIAISPATAQQMLDVVSCGSYILPALDSGNTYYTEADAGGRMLSAGDFIDVPQTVYIYAGEGACADQSNFAIVIDTPAQVARPDDVTACGPYELPPLANGDYFTESGGAGTPLNPGDILTESQIVYVYAELGGCSDESSFNLNIDNPVTAAVLDDVQVCGAYTLPALTNGNYFTENGGAGVQLFSGDAVTASQILYIYLEAGSCSDESSFTVTIDPPSCDQGYLRSICAVTFPKFFTPNGDNRNDVFSALDNPCDSNGKLQIYDRYGKLLYEAALTGFEWDGYASGRQLPASDYWYRFSNFDTESFSTGHFTLKR